MLLLSPTLVSSCLTFLHLCLDAVPTHVHVCDDDDVCIVYVWAVSSLSVQSSFLSRRHIFRVSVHISTNKYTQCA